MPYLSPLVHPRCPVELVAFDRHGCRRLRLAAPSSAAALWWEALATDVFESHGDNHSNGSYVLEGLAELACPSPSRSVHHTYNLFMFDVAHCIGAGC